MPELQNSNRRCTEVLNISTCRTRQAMETCSTISIFVTLINWIIYCLTFQPGHQHFTMYFLGITFIFGWKISLLVLMRLDLQSGIELCLVSLVQNPEHTRLSHSLSLSIYIYVCVCICRYYIYIWRNSLSLLTLEATKRYICLSQATSAKQDQPSKDRPSKMTSKLWADPLFSNFSACKSLWIATSMPSQETSWLPQAQQWYQWKDLNELRYYGFWSRYASVDMLECLQKLYIF